MDAAERRRLSILARRIPVGEIETGRDSDVPCQPGIGDAGQNILRAGQQADRWARIGNQQMAKKPRLQSVCDSYIYGHDRAQGRGRRLADEIGRHDLV